MKCCLNSTLGHGLVRSDLSTILNGLWRRIGATSQK